MEALWSLEDKWKLSTTEAAAFFACTAFLAIGICTAAILRRRAKTKRKGLVHCENEANFPDHPPAHSRTWDSLRKVLSGSVRWSGVSKREERRVVLSGSQSQRERASPLLVLKAQEDNAGRLSHNSSSAVWQRPILMGEKCELPRFSGLILYDEKGMPLDHDHDLADDADNGIIIAPDFQDDQEISSAAVRTTLRDLL